MAISTPPAPGTQVATPHIAIDSVSIRFAGHGGVVQALKNVTLDIERHEFLCIVGRSGCGKTTLLNALAGFVTPTSGVIRVSGRSISGPGPDRAVVFQRDAVFPWMTVEKNIAFSLNAQGKPRDEVKAVVTRYLNLVGLQEFRHAWPRELSGGMKKRVDLARGYAADPDVLLLDEPFGGLDVLTKESLQQELRNLALASPRTCVFVTHDIEEAVFLGDRVVLMSPRPGTVERVWRPDLPRERDVSIKLDSHFVDVRAEITDAIQRESNEH